MFHISSASVRLLSEMMRHGRVAHERGVMTSSSVTQNVTKKNTTKARRKVKEDNGKLSEWEMK
jgi:hypothetical protein